VTNRAHFLSQDGGNGVVPAAYLGRCGRPAYLAGCCLSDGSFVLCGGIAAALDVLFQVSLCGGPVAATRAGGTSFQTPSRCPCTAPREFRAG